MELNGTNQICPWKQTRTINFLPLPAHTQCQSEDPTQWLELHPTEGIEADAHFNEKELRRLSVLLEERLADFNVRGEVMAIRPGPVITTFEFKPARGIKVSKISGLISMS